MAVTARFKTVLRLFQNQNGLGTLRNDQKRSGTLDAVHCIHDLGKFILYMINVPKRLQNPVHFHASKTTETLVFVE
jgi:hypothetical protein